MASTILPRNKGGKKNKYIYKATAQEIEFGTVFPAIHTPLSPLLPGCPAPGGWDCSAEPVATLVLVSGPLLEP